MRVECTYKNLGCTKTYKIAGECLRKHEEKCEFGWPTASNQQFQVKPKSKCSHCGREFTKFGSHKCKAPSVVLNQAFDFSDSFFVNEHISSDDDSFLNTGFSSQKQLTNDNSSFEEQVTNAAREYIGKLKIALLNINSLESKVHEIDFILHNKLIDIFVLNETKLDNSNDDVFFERDAYKLLRRDRTGHGGGVIIYIRNEFKIQHQEFDDTAELIRVNVLLPNGSSITVIACYRPESINCDLFFERLEHHTLESIGSSVNTFIIGDLNFNMLEDNDTPLSEFIYTYGLENTVKQATRLNISTSKWTLLDVILTFCTSLFIATVIIKPSFSDHSLVMSVFDLKSPQTKTNLLNSRCLTRSKLNLIKNALSRINFDPILELNDVNLAWLELWTIIMTILNSLAPAKLVRVKRNGVLWFDGELLNLQKRREYWHNKYCRTKSDVDKHKYIESRNRFRSLFRKKKSEFFQSLVNEGKSSPKSMWSKLTSLKPE